MLGREQVFVVDRSSSSDLAFEERVPFGRSYSSYGLGGRLEGNFPLPFSNLFLKVFRDSALVAVDRAVLVFVVTWYS